jgi:hypothetical protein
MARTFPKPNKNSSIDPKIYSPMQEKLKKQTARYLKAILVKKQWFSLEKKIKLT